MAGASGSEYDLYKKAFYAAERGDLETLEETVKSGFDPSSKKSAWDTTTVLHLAAKEGHLHVVEYLIQSEVSVDATDSSKQTPIHLAAKYDRLAVVEFLIGKGALVNARDILGCTPLHLARSKEICRILVENGADMEAVDFNLWRPLHHAVFAPDFQNHEEKISYLLEKGADVISKDINGDTPCHVAADFNKLDLLKILLPYMKKNLCNGQSQTVCDLINQNYPDTEISEEFSTLLNKFEVLTADPVMLDELPKLPRLETEFLLQYWDKPDYNSVSEDLVTPDDAKNILNELEQTSVEGKEKYLKSLLERFAHPRAYWTTRGQRGYDLATRVQEFVTYFLGEAAKIDPKFAGTSELVGSCADGTRLGQPKEFDFLLVIEDLSNKESLKRNAEWDSKGRAQVFVEPSLNIEEGNVKECLTEKDHHKRWNNLLRNGDKLCANSVLEYFFNLLRETTRRLESFTKFDFSFRKCLNSRYEYYKRQHTVPLVRPMKTGCTLRLRCLQTGLLIDVDVVPGIKFQGRPHQCEIPFDEMRKVVPPSVIDRWEQ